jgi:hypothetical protein
MVIQFLQFERDKKVFLKGLRVVFFSVGSCCSIHKGEIKDIKRD